MSLACRVLNGLAALLLVGWFALYALAQPVPPRRPAHVENPKVGAEYWCILQPYERGHQHRVEAPWRGRYTEAVGGPEMVYREGPHGMPYIAVKAPARYLFHSHDAARKALAWDWQHPPESSRVAFVFDARTLGKIRTALDHARRSEGYADGGVKGSMIVDMDSGTAMHLLGTTALGLDVELYPHVEIRNPPGAWK